MGSALSLFGSKEEQWSWPTSDREGRSKLLFGDPVCYGTTMFRKAILRANGLRCYEDWRLPGMDFLFLLGAAPFMRFANLPDVLTYYRIGEQNMRHGRDPLRDKGSIYARVFDMLGIQGGEKEVRLQLMLHRLFREAPNTTDVIALSRWIDCLKAWNRESGHFPEDGFEAELDRRFRRLFFLVADRRIIATFEHMLNVAGFTAGILRYLLQVLIPRLFGWRPENSTTKEPSPALAGMRPPLDNAVR